jgi:hypothetical protein
MATLKRRRDGAYYLVGTIRHSRTVVTWQIRGSGVDFLQERGYVAGSYVDSDMLDLLQRMNWIYTGGGGVTPERLEPASGRGVGVPAAARGGCGTGCGCLIGSLALLTPALGIFALSLVR